MVEIEKPRIESNEKDGDISYGKYVVEPLEHGYGTTLGNALRRILLSSLPGTAVTTIKIAGVQHEFSTIPGVKEDVTQIVLNVKGITAKLHSPGTKRCISRPAAKARSLPATSKPTAKWRSSIRSFTSQPSAPTLR